MADTPSSSYTPHPDDLPFQLRDPQPDQPPEDAVWKYALGQHVEFRGSGNGALPYSPGMHEGTIIKQLWTGRSEQKRGWPRYWVSVPVWNGEDVIAQVREGDVWQVLDHAPEPRNGRTLNGRTGTYYPYTTVACKVPAPWVAAIDSLWGEFHSRDEYLAGLVRADLQRRGLLPSPSPPSPSL